MRGAFSKKDVVNNTAGPESLYRRLENHAQIVSEAMDFGKRQKRLTGLQTKEGAAMRGVLVLILDFLNSNVGAFQVLFALIVAIFTGLYVWVTLRMWREMRANRLSQERPWLLAYIKPSREQRNMLHLIIENIGRGMAHNVSFEVDKDITVIGRRKLSNFNLFTKGVPFIASQQRFDILFCKFTDYIEEKQPMQFTVTATYFDNGINSKRRHKYHEPFPIDLDVFVGQHDPDEKTLKDVVKELHEIKEEIGKRNASA